MPVSTAENHGAAFLAFLVEDHKLSKEKLSPKCFEVMQKMAFLAACYINKVPLDRELPQSFEKNKLTFSSAEYVQLPQDHPCAGGVARPGFRFTKPESEVRDGEEKYFYIGIPTEDEGLSPFENTPPTFRDFMKRVSDEPCIGGNIPNAALNAALMIEALHFIDESLHIVIATPEKTSLSKKLEERMERMRDVLRIVLLSGVQPREGLHIPVEFLHNDESGNRAQNIMINSEGPSIPAILATITDIRAQLEQCMLYAGDHRLELHAHNGTRMIPSTASRETLAPDSGEVLLLNTDEFAQFMRNADLWDQQDTLLPVTNTTIGTTSHVNLNKTNAAFRAIVRAFLAKQPEGKELESQPQRFAQIGMTNGMILDVFIVGSEILFLETSAMKEWLIKTLIECAGSESIGLDKTELTGRGDAAAAATILDSANPEKLLTWWKDKHTEMSETELNSEQLMLLRMILPAVMSRLNAKLVHFTPGSNLFDAIDAEGYRRVLDLGMSISINLVMAKKGEVNSEPQLLEDETSLMKTTMWKIPRNE